MDHIHNCFDYFTYFNTSLQHSYGVGNITSSILQIRKLISYGCYLLEVTQVVTELISEHRHSGSNVCSLR